MIYLQDADFTLHNCDVLEGLAQLSLLGEEAV